MHRSLRTSIPLLAVLVLGAGWMGGSAAAKKHKPLKVSCEQLYAEIEKTGAQLQAQYNAMGFTIGVPDPAFPGEPAQDGFISGKGCQKQGKRVRMGVGYMNDIPNEDGGFPGETNPAIREYFWTWHETVVRTKKGRLRDTITSLSCEKYSYDGFANNPQNLQSYPC